MPGSMNRGHSRWPWAQCPWAYTGTVLVSAQSLGAPTLSVSGFLFHSGNHAQFEQAAFYSQSSQMRNAGSTTPWLQSCGEWHGAWIAWWMELIQVQVCTGRLYQVACRHSQAKSSSIHANWLRSEVTGSGISAFGASSSAAGTAIKCATCAKLWQCLMTQQICTGGMRTTTGRHSFPWKIS